MEKIQEEEEKKEEMKLIDIVPRDKIMSKDPKKIIYEGELLRLCPGLSQMYYPKWMQLTRYEFRYYKDQLSAINWLTQPLTVIPLTQIDKVERVTVTVDSIKKKKVPYQFEIFFKDIEFPNRFIKNAEKSNSGTNSYYNSQLRETAVGIEISQKDKKNYVSYIKTNAEALTKVGIKEHIEGNNNNTKAKGLSGSGSLTNRTVIWKKIKEKHIYAHENKLECEKWVFILNWLIDIHRDSS